MSVCHPHRLAYLAAAAALLVATGCVERIMKIDSRPQGARVFVNDREMGVTPARIAFLWYGDYDIILRKQGYETVKTHHRINPPWYEYPPIDVVAECLVPSTIQDEHTLPTYELAPAHAPPIQELVEDALQTREEALAEQP